MLSSVKLDVLLTLARVWSLFWHSRSKIACRTCHWSRFMASAGAGLRAELVCLFEGYSVSVLLPAMLSPLSSSEWNVSLT